MTIPSYRKGEKSFIKCGGCFWQESQIVASLFISFEQIKHRFSEIKGKIFLQFSQYGLSQKYAFKIVRKNVFVKKNRNFVKKNRNFIKKIPIFLIF